LPLLFLWIGVGPARAEPFSIAAFKSERVQPQQGNAIVVPAEGRFLATLSAATLPENAIVLRRKFGKDEYGLFAGLLKEGGYARLRAFRIEGADKQALLKLKFYDSPERDWYLDLDEAYFEDQLVLVEGRSELYYKTADQWKKAVALAQPPSRLSVASQPSGAQVWIDGSAAGGTPLQMRGIGQPLLRVQMRLPGYYMVDEPVQIKPGQHQMFSARLVPRADADTQSLRSFDSSAIARLRAANAPGQAAYVERQAKLVRLEDSLRTEQIAELARFDRGYPPMKGKDEFEKSAEFEKRKAEYETERIAQRKLFGARRDAQIGYLADVYRSLDTLLRPFEERRFKALSACPAKLGLYDADAEVQSLNLDCSEAGIRYLGACDVSIKPDEARRLRLSPDSLRVAFYGWNIQAEAADGRIVRMSWDSLGFTAFNAPEKRGACTQAPSTNAWEALAMERAGKKAAFFAREAARRNAEELARRDSVAAAEKRLAGERQRRLEEDRAESLRKSAAKRKRILRTARIGLGSALITSALVLAWNGKSQAAEAETASDRYRNSLSVEAAGRNKAAFLRHSRLARNDYLAGGFLFALSLPLLAF
jgi:hypothetical protein